MKRKTRNKSRCRLSNRTYTNSSRKTTRKTSRKRSRKSSRKRSRKTSRKTSRKRSRKTSRRYKIGDDDTTQPQKIVRGFLNIFGLLTDYSQTQGDDEEANRAVSESLQAKSQGSNDLSKKIEALDLAQQKMWLMEVIAEQEKEAGASPTYPNPSAGVSETAPIPASKQSAPPPPVPGSKKKKGGVAPAATIDQVPPVTGSKKKKGGGGVSVAVPTAPPPGSKNPVGAGGANPAKAGKKTKGDEGIKWAEQFANICPLLDGGFSIDKVKYPKIARNLMNTSQAMVNPATKKAMTTYLTDVHNPILALMTVFSGGTSGYPAHYLKWILKWADITPPYKYTQWSPDNTKLIDVFDGVVEDQAIISASSCLDEIPSHLIKITGDERDEIIKNNLSHTYSPYIIATLFDIIARYFYIFGQESSEMVIINTKKTVIEDALVRFAKNDTLLSCPIYTTALADILSTPVDIRKPCRASDGESDEFQDCPYESDALDILRKLNYACIDDEDVGDAQLSIKTLVDSGLFSDYEDELKVTITDRLVEELAGKDMNVEEQELVKNLIVFKEYSRVLGEMADDDARAAVVITNRNSSMMKKADKRTSPILFLSLLIKSLRDHNSNFIDKLNVGNVDELIKETREILATMPKICKSGNPKHPQICDDFTAAAALKTKIKDAQDAAKSPKAPKAGASIVKTKTTSKKQYEKGLLDQKVWRNLTLQTASKKLVPKYYEL